MTEPNVKLSFARQCQFLNLARSTYFYQPQPADDAQLTYYGKWMSTT